MGICELPAAPEGQADRDRGVGRRAAKAAAEKIAARLALGDCGIFTESAPKSPTVAQIAADWERATSPAWKHGTKIIYGNILKARIIPAFGSLPITDLTADRVEAWWTQTRESGLSRKSLANYRRVLWGVCERAVVQEYLRINPVRRIMGRLGRQDEEVGLVDYLSGDELAAMLAATERVCPRGYPALLLMGTGGLRVGEAQGVQIGDLDERGARIHVRRSIGRAGHISSPKNGKGRVVDLPARTVAVLAKLRELRQVEAAVEGREARWFFPGDVAGRPVERTAVARWLAEALKAAGVRRVHPHVLRHTYATLALLAGVPLLTVSRQLGHSSNAITADTYCHAVPGGNRAAADAMEAILAPATHLDASPAQVAPVTP